MTDKEKLLYKALCFSDVTTNFFVRQKGDNSYEILMKSGKPLNVKELEQAAKGYSIHGPLSFNEYLELYAAVFIQYCKVRTHNTQGIFKQIDSLYCRLIGQYFILTAEKSEYFILTPNGQIVLLRNSNGTFDSSNIVNLICDAYNPYVDKAENVLLYIDSYSDIAARLGDVTVLDTLYWFDVDCGIQTRGITDFWEDLRKLRHYNNVLAMHLYAYFTEFALKRKYGLGADCVTSTVKQTNLFDENILDEDAQSVVETVMEGSMSDLLANYIKAMKLTKRADLCDELSRMIELSCDKESVENIRKFLQCTVNE